MSKPSHAEQPGSCEVLIVGAGPTGLTLAIELARRGIHCRIIDQADEPSRYSKALGVMSRTLELLEQAGLAEEFIARGLPIEQVSVYSGKKQLADIPFGQRIASKYPYALMLPQNETEEILLQRLEQLGVTVERSTTLTEIQHYDENAEQRQHSSAVASSATAVSDSASAQPTSRAVLPHFVSGSRIQMNTTSATGQNGKQTHYRLTATIVKQASSAPHTSITSHIHAGWVVGCDGAHSTVRHLLRMPFKGTAITQDFALADVMVSGNIAHDRLQIYLHQGRIAAFFPMKSGRHRVIVASPVHAQQTATDTDGTGKAREISLQDVQQVLDECTGGQYTVSDPIWMTRFSVNQRKVEHYRAGAVLLAGDAAHIHSPVGGQGMNTGIQDAYNLGWKLALICQGRADEMLLDSYEEEREPVARSLLRWTGVFTRLAINRFPLLAMARDTVAPLLSSRSTVQRLMARAISETDIHYRHSELVLRGENWRHGMVAPGDRAPDAGAGLDWWDNRKHLLLVFPEASPQMPSPTNPELWDEDERTRIPLLIRIGDSWRSVTEIVNIMPDQPLMLPQPQPNHFHQDVGSVLRKRYGMEQGGYVMLRPDGYVGFAGSLKDEMELIGWVYRLFRIPSSVK
ncbi:FAD-dependent monooxygenase [Paenibacillus kandeliae]|uniref:FAD-dependent monooxygenase n=1 Tax=Paenibacillus kandeliae TaxID=3231269 RepID=UPI0034573F87